MKRFYDAIMGLVVGDALGVPYEFCARDSFKAEGMIGYGTWYQPPGTWSDDSSMTLATIASLAKCGKVDPNDIMHNFSDWIYHGKFTPHGVVFDAGRTTISAIHNFMMGIPAESCGGTSKFDNGNGALMRILPMAFYPRSGLCDVCRVAGLTHNHDISQIACGMYIDIAKMIKNGLSPKLSIKRTVDLFDYRVGLSKEFNRLGRLDELSRDEIKSTGFVVDTLEAALWCILKASSYRECVLMAVNLGGDTDTIAAVAGGLAGILYGIGGEKGIPEEWIDKLQKKDEIKALCRDFCDIFTD